MPHLTAFENTFANNSANNSVEPQNNLIFAATPKLLSENRQEFELALLSCYSIEYLVEAAKKIAMKRRLPKDERNSRRDAISSRITLISAETRDQISQEDSDNTSTESNVARRDATDVEADTPQQDSEQLISAGEQGESAVQLPDEEIRALQLIEHLTLEKNKLLSIPESKPKAEIARVKAIASLDEKIGNLERFIKIQPGSKVTKKNGNTEGTVTEKNISPGGMPHLFVLWGGSKLPISEAISVINCLSDRDRWNPADFKEAPRLQDEMGNPLIFFDTTVEPPEPDDYSTIEAFETTWDRWVATQEGTSEEELAHISAAQVWEQEQDLNDRIDTNQFWRCKHGLHPTITPDNIDPRFIRCDTLSIEEQIKLCSERITSQQWRIDNLMENCKAGKSRDDSVASANSAQAEERQRIEQLEYALLQSQQEKESQNLKAITLHQPWASLVGVAKLFETRGWSTDYRGKIAIHAAKMQKDTDDWCEQLSDLLSEVELVFGAIVAIADLTDCIFMDEEFISQQSAVEIRCGLWKPGRYAWKLENIQILPEPIPAKGKQGLWDIQIPIPENNPLPKISTDFQIGDRIEFLCDVSVEKAPLKSGTLREQGTSVVTSGNPHRASGVIAPRTRLPLGEDHTASPVDSRNQLSEISEINVASDSEPQTFLFDSLELDELAKLIKSQQEEFELSRREYESATANHLEKNIRLGHILNAAKAKVKESKSGRWLKWLENNCPQINERTARLAMRLARNEASVREKSATVADFGVRKAASLLNKDPEAKVTPMKRRSKCRWEANPDGSRRYEVNLCGIKRELHDTYQQAAVEIERASLASGSTPEELIVEGLIKLVAENHGISEQGAIALAIEVATKINAVAA